MSKSWSWQRCRETKLEILRLHLQEPRHRLHSTDFVIRLGLLDIGLSVARDFSDSPFVNSYYKKFTLLALGVPQVRVQLLPAPGDFLQAKSALWNSEDRFEIVPHSDSSDEIWLHRDFVAHRRGQTVRAFIPQPEVDNTQSLDSLMVTIFERLRGWEPVVLVKAAAVVDGGQAHLFFGSLATGLQQVVRDAWASGMPVMSVTDTFLHWSPEKQFTASAVPHLSFEAGANSPVWSRASEQWNVLSHPVGSMCVLENAGLLRLTGLSGGEFLPVILSAIQHGPPQDFHAKTASPFFRELSEALLLQERLCFRLSHYKGGNFWSLLRAGVQNQKDLEDSLSAKDKSVKKMSVLTKEP